MPGLDGARVDDGDTLVVVDVDEAIGVRSQGEQM